MTAAHRVKRDDCKSSILVADATVIENGELLFLDSTTAKPASSQTDQLSEPANQRLFASLFLGAAAGGKLASQTWIDSILVDWDPTAEREYDCVSETHQVGDLMGVDEADSGTALNATRLVKVTDEALAIARCVRTDTAASTTCRVRFIKSLFMGAPDADTKLQDAIASSTAVTATGPTVFSNGSKTINGGALKAGDILRLKAAGIVTTATGAETTTVRILVGTEVVATTGAVDVASGDVFRLEVDVVVREVGSSGKLLSHGLVALGVPGTVTAKPFCTAEVTEDISSAALTATCDVTNSSTGESVLLHAFSVEHIRI